MNNKHILIGGVPTRIVRVPVDVLRLPCNVTAQLKKNRVKTLAGLVRQRRGFRRAIPGLGDHWLAILERRLEDLGLRLLEPQDRTLRAITEEKVYLVIAAVDRPYRPEIQVEHWLVWALDSQAFLRRLQQSLPQTCRVTVSCVVLPTVTRTGVLSEDQVITAAIGLMQVAKVS